MKLCFKEAITDSATLSFTWFGCKQGQESLYNTRRTKAIFGTKHVIFLCTIIITISVCPNDANVLCVHFSSEAVCRNTNFHKPTRSTFQDLMKKSLRTAKERMRVRTRIHPRTETACSRTARRDLWSYNSLADETLTPRDSAP